MNSRLASVLAILLLVFTVFAGCTAPTPTPTPAALAPAASEFISLEEGKVTLHGKPLQLKDNQATLSLNDIKNTTNEKQTLYIRVMDEDQTSPAQFGDTNSIGLEKNSITGSYNPTFTGTLMSGHTYHAELSLKEFPAPGDVEPKGGTHCCAAKAP